MLCPYCGSNKIKKNGFRDGKQNYKCKECGRKHTEGAKLRSKPKEKVIRDCAYCGNPTENPKFCSVNCAATYNLTRFPPKKKRKRFCKHCGTEIKERQITCRKCNPNTVEWDNVTLASITDRASYQVAANVRRRARWRYCHSSRPKYCVNCGYDKHYEVCHIHAIMDFPPETTIAEINSLQNLVALCPTCHWEFDNGLLSMEEIRAKNDSIS